MIDAKTIEELQGLLAKATLGPWSTHLVDDTTIISPDREVGTTCDSSHTEREDGYNIEYERMEADAALIVAMRNALPALLDAASRAREDALREAGAEAKTAWLHYPRGEIGDADHDSALCEYVAERIAIIDKPKDAPAPLPAASVDGGEDA